MQGWQDEIRDTVASSLEDTALKEAASKAHDANTRCEGLTELQCHADSAYDRLKTGKGDVQKNRRVYTEASFLLALCPTQDAKDSIATLDKAIVVAGAEGWVDLVTLAIRQLQADHFPPRTFTSGTPSTSSIRPALPLPNTSQIIPCLSEPPSLASFQREFSQSPFILRAFVTEWPAMREHPWASYDYLRCVAGPCRVVPVEVGRDYRSNDWTQRMMDWDEFLACIEQEENEEVLYLAQHNLFTQFPALRDDIIIPDYVYACPTATPDGYHPPANEEQLVTNAWLGPRGTISPAHTDPYFNFYAQVVGRKTVWLAPPSSTPHMCPHTETMTNTSQLDVFSSSSIVPGSMAATLEPGDLLFLPPGWWHAMRSESVSFSVSMWF